MENRLVVRIDLELLRRNLSKADARDCSLEEVSEWLTQSGFTRREDGLWLVHEEDMGQLDPSEVKIEGSESD
jgi:hypothetical protein